MRNYDFEKARMMKISAAIITFNEEENIRRCLESVAPIADEIVVVDSFSTDQTERICRDFSANFILHAFEGHIGQKNFAASQTGHDYVLSLDADEALSSELLESLKKVKERGGSDAYSFNRVTNYCGQWIYHCGWYPDTKIRLWKKDKGKWGGKNPHDIIELEQSASLTHLSGDLLHYSYSSIEDHVEQTNKFTTIAARAAYDLGKRSNLFKVVTRGPLKFLRDYFWKRGFLDGANGFIICSINSLSAFLKYAKLWRLQK